METELHIQKKEDCHDGVGGGSGACEDCHGDRELEGKDSCDTQNRKHILKVATIRRSTVLLNRRNANMARGTTQALMARLVFHNANGKTRFLSPCNTAHVPERNAPIMAIIATLVWFLSATKPSDTVKPAAKDTLRLQKMLLIEDKSAAYKADNDGKTALHVASGLGSVDIMREFISSCLGCCEPVDNRRRNVLHFASTSKNRKAVKLVLENPSLGNLINEKDENGNTPFLPAASMRFIFIHPKVDTLVFNNDNHNAANMVNPLAFYALELQDIILWCLTSLRIKRCRLLMSKDDDEEGRENKGNHLVSSKSKDGIVGQNHLLVATLIATVTFAAGFTVPGGFMVEKGPDQGAPILIRNSAFKAFVILNTMFMFWSSYAVFTHLSRWRATNTTERFKRKRLRQVLIGYALLAMIGAFVSGTCTVLLHGDKKLAISALVIPATVLVFVGILNAMNPRNLRKIANYTI
ncbi:hypothetical protein EZV62_002863 [Acer yangbiense]|uniref:PGG domain-containing protein n=1 Tax=Acer yangbiense TaxID=1000413 RepID=A0A5C7IZE8_9ROSI|nr:hypothetical protein EZV62_002863 [Acer yangbiense]